MATFINDPALGATLFALLAMNGLGLAFVVADLLGVFDQTLSDARLQRRIDRFVMQPKRGDADYPAWTWVNGGPRYMGKNQ